MSFNLPIWSTADAMRAAVRVQFRYGNSSDPSDPCIDGGYNDRDDLVFDVLPPGE